LRSEARRAQQRREPYRQRRPIIFRQRQQRRVAPHVRRPTRNFLACYSQRFVVVADFQRRETILADRTRLIAPALSALTTAQFVPRHGLLFPSSSRGKI